MPQNKKRRERGNAFFFVLLGIVLFAALAMTISRGMRGNVTARLTSKEIEIKVSEIINYTQRLERAIDRVRQRGCSENDISFENGVVTGYEHTPAAPEKCRIFASTGGAVTWASPGFGTEQYQFWGLNAVKDIGSAKNDLVMALHIEQPDLCAAFNKKIGLSSVPNGNGNEVETLFTGDFGSSLVSIDEAAGKNAACINADGDGDYIIYKVLLAR